MNNITIIGGGITGLYYKYKHNDEDIQLYESSDRLGGRIMTENNYGINTEYGAIRFEWGCQPLLKELLTELNIDVTGFPSFCGNKGKELMLIKEICEYIWSKYHGREVCIDDITYEDLTNVYQKPWVKYQGDYIYIYEITCNTYIKSVNFDWYQKLQVMDTEIDTFPINNWSLMLWLLRWTKVLITNHSIKTIDRGNSQIINTLKNRFNSKDIHLNYELHKIVQKNDYYKLYFTNQEIKYTKELVLTIPCQSLLKIKYTFRPEIYTILNMVRPYRLGRIFIYVKDPFWKTSDLFNLQNYRRKELHTREVYYYTNNNTGLIMLYFDELYFDFWRVKSDNDIRNHIISCGFKNIIDIKTFYWDGKDNPYAFYYLDKNINPEIAIDTLYHADRDMHIITDCTLEPGFIEGSLQIIHSKL